MATNSSADTGSNVAIMAVLAALVGTALFFLASVLAPAAPEMVVAHAKPAQHVAAVVHPGDRS